MSSAREPAFAADGTFAGWSSRGDWQPPTLTNDERAAVAEAVRYYEAVTLAPGDPLEISGRVATLLAHWRDPGLPDAMRDQIMRDWLTILGRFPLWAVCEAAAEWLEFNRLRPSVAEIRLLCDRAIKVDRDRLVVLRRALEAAPDR